MSDHSNQAQRLTRHYNPSCQRAQETGIRGLYRFENQHGASVIYAHPMLVNGAKSEYELAHVVWKDESVDIHNWSFARTALDEPEITTCLTEEEVQQYLDQIAAL